MDPRGLVPIPEHASAETLSSGFGRRPTNRLSRTLARHIATYLIQSILVDAKRFLTEVNRVLCIPVCKVNPNSTNSIWGLCRVFNNQGSHSRMRLLAIDAADLPGPCGVGTGLSCEGFQRGRLKSRTWACLYSIGQPGCRTYGASAWRCISEVQHSRQAGERKYSRHSDPLLQHWILK